MPTWNEIKPSISVDSSGNLLYLQFTESYYASIVRAQDEKWKLSMWYHSNESEGETFLSFYPNSIKVIENNHDINKVKWIYGMPKLNYDIQFIDISRLLNYADDLAQLIDTTGWGVVQSTDGSNICKIYATPDEAASVICELFTGAPVRVVRNEAIWAEIHMDGIVGWLPTSAIAEGRDMLSVQRCFPQLEITLGGNPAAPNIFSQPDITSKSIYKISTNDMETSRAISVIGKLNDTWLLVYHSDGFWGFMESQWFYKGNG